ncbi:hypothetical protein NF700_06970 [Sphingomonadaceae bacterium OTU29MARTA1]|nr:hypothetical protein NF700_06970 [Sphingomonadaceae bacterium OTU29MARTA1]
MMLMVHKPIVMIEDAPDGYFVWIEIDADAVEGEEFFRRHHSAKAYARGLAVGRGYAIDDRSSEFPEVVSIDDIRLVVCS